MTNGGEAPNAIPALTEGRWYVRAESLERLAETEEKVWRCFQAGALGTGCTLDITPESKPYAEFRTDQMALRSYVENAERLGRKFDDRSPARRMNRASTDMGMCRSWCQRSIRISASDRSQPKLQPEFAANCVGAAAEKALLDAATALAWTALDVAKIREQLLVLPTAAAASADDSGRSSTGTLRKLAQQIGRSSKTL